MVFLKKAIENVLVSGAAKYMLYEFALSPAIFDKSTLEPEKAEIILVQLLLGLQDNGLLANFDKGQWLKHVKERIELLPPALKDNILTCLEILDNRHRLVRHPKRLERSPNSDNEWLSLIFESHDRIPFDFIILNDKSNETTRLSDKSIIKFLSILNSARWRSRSRSITLRKNFQDYRNILKKILRHAKSLSLVDPYLNYKESRYFDTIEICSNVMGQRGHSRLNGRIDIHCELNKQKPNHKNCDDHKKVWKEKLRKLMLNDKHKFRVFLWESLPGSETLHDRYILTDQCAIMTPGGLDCRNMSHANKTKWCLLDENERIDLLNDYRKEANIFKLRGVVEV